MFLLLGAARPSKFLWDVETDLGSVNSCERWRFRSLVLGVGHPRIGFFLDGLFGGLLVVSLATNRSRRLDDYVTVLSRSRSTSDQSSWILTLSIIGAMKDAEATCQ
jgi:hypothetical protein